MRGSLDIRKVSQHRARAITAHGRSGRAATERVVDELVIPSALGVGGVGEVVVVVVVGCGAAGLVVELDVLGLRHPVALFEALVLTR